MKRRMPASISQNKSQAMAFVEISSAQYTLTRHRAPNSLASHAAYAEVYGSKPKVSSHVSGSRCPGMVKSGPAVGTESEYVEDGVGMQYRRM